MPTAVSGTGRKEARGRRVPRCVKTCCVGMLVVAGSVRGGSDSGSGRVGGRPAGLSDRRDDYAHGVVPIWLSIGCRDEASAQRGALDRRLNASRFSRAKESANLRRAPGTGKRSAAPAPARRPARRPAGQARPLGARHGARHGARPCARSGPGSAGAATTYPASSAASRTSFCLLQPFQRPVPGRIVGDPDAHPTHPSPTAIDRWHEPRDRGTRTRSCGTTTRRRRAVAAH